MPRPPLVAASALALALTFGVGACSADEDPPQAKTSALEQCHDQWGEVAESVVGLDTDPNPSALASRWTSVVATVDYYRNTKTAKDCETQVESQVKAITLLRQFSEKLRPYDMAYQLDRVSASIDLYLHEPLPKPARNENGKLVKPPTKAVVTAAIGTLTAHATNANGELQPGWGQLASVELTDATAVKTALDDLDFLAQDSPSWRQCEAALQVLVAAVRAQEGSVGGSTPTPTP
ncbi:hypothetical protein EFK50_03795 [Nocardioides marmoriginsengisoli]|uniref:Lipoprotein n=1 Tax=Nocardioides marmoriginsengisoli TaxID=661483 RepID=A0A3N0CNP8_9ACTN|nr:hypothetical protein [Nocardioides marmoriginsengisoli]RNL65104.1 hypothetical protein EFK50_03795 [Nocardioides marmoriginsengisoli]